MSDIALHSSPTSWPAARAPLRAPAHRGLRAAGLRASLLLVVALLASAATLPAQDTLTLGGRRVVEWRPAAPSSSPAPIIVFSHGFGGCATQSRFLTESLAAHGYWVLAVDHKDARCRIGVPSRPLPFGRPDDWTDGTYRDRADDVRAVLEAVASSTQLRGHVDLTRIALVGHSLGGYTVLGLAGAWPSWRLPGVRAVLALSPYVQPFLAHGTLNELRVPVMYQGGTMDFGITPAVARSGGAYDVSPAPKYFVEYAGYGHFAWTNLRADSHEPIDEYALAFLDHYVRGLPASPMLTHAGEVVSQLRYDSELGIGRTGARNGAASAPRRKPVLQRP